MVTITQDDRLDAFLTDLARFAGHPGGQPAAPADYTCLAMESSARSARDRLATLARRSPRLFLRLARASYPTSTLARSSSPACAMPSWPVMPKRAAAAAAGSLPAGGHGEPPRCCLADMFM